MLVVVLSLFKRRYAKGIFIKAINPFSKIAFLIYLLRIGKNSKLKNALRKLYYTTKSPLRQ